MRKMLGILLATAMLSNPLYAQITSGILRGTVKDVTGSTIENANVTVVFVPTNQRIVTKTTTEGRFVLSNLKPGGPYSVSVTALGFRPKSTDNLTVRLGEATTADLEMEKIVVTLDQVSVVADLAAQARKDGVTAQLNHEKLQVLPTLSRSLQDMTRMTPQGNGVSFAGSNYRYNNLTIDGATSNDAFGFSQSSGQSTASVPTGTPGSLSRTQPISLDAIEQVSVVIAPYDVKIGNFTGGSVNAVTRSGTNRTEGSIYSFGRNPQMIGNGISGRIPTTFRELQNGARIGGPIIKNKLFYFANVEISRRTDPVLFAPGTGGALATEAIAQQVRDSLVSFAARSGVPNFDAGTFGAYNVNANIEKYFGRLDWNIGNSILTVRSNYVNAIAGNLERGQALNKLASQDFDHLSQTTNTVAELKSQLGTGVSNSLLLGYSLVEDHRNPYGSVYAPQIEIQDIQFGQINAGSDREGVVYRTRSRTFEFTNNLTWSKNNHTITVGTHNEFYNIQYTFVNGYAGRWQYANLASFFANRPNRIRATFDLTDNSLDYVLNNPGANFNIAVPSVYIQDEVAITDALKVSAGVRADWNIMDTPTQAEAFTNLTLTNGAKPYSTVTNDYGRSLLIGPRFGFSWQKDRVTYRGGIGYFQGRMPFAWYAYPFIHNGLVVGNIDTRPTTTVPLIVDPLRQSTLSSTTTYEMNVIGNNYVQPQMRRMNLAADIKLPYDALLVMDWTYTKTLNDIVFTNIGLPAPAGNLAGGDRRPVYTTTRLNTTTSNPYTSVFALNNTNLGHRYNITANLSKKWNYFDAMVAYSYGEAKDLANGQRNSFQSHVEYNQLVKGNQYDLTWSNFDIRHRFVGTGTWTWKKNTTISAVYTGASGSPFSYVYSGDLNGDGSSHNDLIYIPRNIDEIKLVPSARPTGQVDTRTPAQIWADLDEFIRNDPYLSGHRGEYARRNGARTPWNHRVDVRITQDVTKGILKNTQVTFDITNFGNLLNENWGKFYFVPNLNNQNVYPLQYRSGRGVNSVPTFSFDPMKNTYQTDDLMSRWQMQMGIRVNF
jgi:hypothetical protein